MMRKKKERLGILQWILMALLLLVTLTMLVPLLHILARSLSDPSQSGSMGGSPASFSSLPGDQIASTAGT